MLDDGGTGVIFEKDFSIGPVLILYGFQLHFIWRKNETDDGAGEKNRSSEGEQNRWSMDKRPVDEHNEDTRDPAECGTESDSCGANVGRKELGCHDVQAGIHAGHAGVEEGYAENDGSGSVGEIAFGAGCDGCGGEEGNGGEEHGRGKEFVASDFVGEEGASDVSRDAGTVEENEIQVYVAEVKLVEERHEPLSDGSTAGGGDP